MKMLDKKELVRRLLQLRIDQGRNQHEIVIVNRTSRQKINPYQVDQELEDEIKFLRNEIVNNVAASEIHGLINCAFDDIFSDKPVDTIDAYSFLEEATNRLIFSIHNKDNGIVKVWMN